MGNRVLLGMSGGVDSSVSAILLKKNGYDIVGATMQLCENIGNESSINDAKKICEKLEIPYYVIDCKEEFNKKVINDFINCYENAKTPNPCIECNKYLKFGKFVDNMKKFECDYIATGHYAKLEYSEKYNQIVLKKSKNEKKDQSYFLYKIPKEILPKIIFPLEDYKDKEEIRKIAEENKLKIANKKDSQEICFIKDNDYAKFINEKSNHKFKTGNIVNLKGDILGTHNGIINYTVGQRKGLGISYNEPLYILRINKEKNEIIVGQEKELYTKEVYIEDINYIVDCLKGCTINVTAKVRYRAKEANAILYPVDKNKAKIIFEEPQRAITPGQSLVFYIDDVVIGGGKIT